MPCFQLSPRYYLNSTLDINLSLYYIASSRRVWGGSHYEHQRQHRDGRDSEGRSYHQYDHHQHHHRDNHQGGNTKPRGDEDWNHSEVNFVHTPSKVEAYILVLGS